MSQFISLIIIGAGGFGAEAAWVANRLNQTKSQFEVLGFCDDNPNRVNTVVNDYRVLGSIESTDVELAEKPHFICSIGNNKARKSCVLRALSLGWIPTTLVDPSVIVADSSTIAEGTYIGAGSIISPNVKIGSHVLINQHCSIGHDSRLEDYSQVSPGGRISGYCSLGVESYVGSNGVVAPGVSLGYAAVLGAASFAIKNIPENSTAVGTPARILLKA